LISMIAGYRWALAPLEGRCEFPRGHHRFAVAAIARAKSREIRVGQLAALDPGRVNRVSWCMRMVPLNIEV